tara:strand:- start:670 stop:1428 length:759 start_codon:yes stop_codon:yes gene_type:complete
MALSSSGSISLSQIQTEFGGSNPISLSEYYQGNIPSNSSSTIIYPSVATTTTTYSTSSKLGTFTYERITSGFNHSSLATTEIPALGTTTGVAVTKFTGRDIAGNAGNIPVNGAIQMNHFRGTAAPVNSGFTIWAFYATNFRITSPNPGSFGTPNIIIRISGHHGSNVSLVGGQSGFPFTFVRNAAEGSGSQLAQGDWQGSNTWIANGPNVSQGFLSHGNNATIGNYTQLLFGGTLSAVYRNFSGTMGLTFHF